MRQWLVNPKFLCNQHLLGEHVESHMFVGTILKNKSLDGYIKNGLVDTTQIQSRHDVLVAEMLARGFNHSSPLPKFEIQAMGHVNKSENLKELARRCPKCRELIENVSA